VRRYSPNFPWRNTCPTPEDGYYDATVQGSFDLQNAEEGYYKYMSVLDGLANSINTITFATAARVDLCGIQKIADAVGIHGGHPSNDSPNPQVPMTRLSNLIGATQTAPLTMASAFATFANNGRYCEPIAIDSVTDATGAKLPAQTPNCRDAVTPEVAHGVAYAMQEVLNRGSGSLIRPRISTRTTFPIAAKTGTNDNNSSTWVAGYTSGLATAAWFGDPLGDQQRAGQNVTINGQFYTGIDGYMIAGPEFSNYMAQIAPKYGTDPFPAPPSNMLDGPAPVSPPRATLPMTQSTTPASDGNTGGNAGHSSDPSPAPSPSKSKSGKK
jgi:membrane peptidoglycan carboxypeptidase